MMLRFSPLHACCFPQLQIEPLGHQFAMSTRPRPGKFCRWINLRSMSQNPLALPSVAIQPTFGTSSGKPFGVPIRRATQKSDSSRFRVSGFGFRRLKPTFAVGFGFRRLKPTFGFGFGFRVSSIETNFRCRFRVSGFGFRRLKPTSAVGFGFRRLKPTFAVGFGFRVSSIETNFRCRFRVSGFVD